LHLTLLIAASVNISGTSDEYPNWRRKLSVTLEALFSAPGTEALLRDLTARSRRSGQS